MTKKLAQMKCMPCDGEGDVLSGEERRRLQAELEDGWEVVDGHHLHRRYAFDDFRQALDFTNRIGELAEEQGHHPEITLTWGRVDVKIWTHKVDGLTQSDFVLAAKADEAG